MKVVAGFITALILLCSTPLGADDTDIYGVSTVSVPPNVLIIFDNSGSMDIRDVPGEVYDPNITYAGTYPRDQVYRKKRRRWVWFANDVNDLNCASMKTALQTDGYVTGRIQNGPSYNCGGRRRRLRIGNYRNYLALGLGAKRKRIDVAKEVITDLINTKGDTLRFGVMVFHYDEGGYILEPLGTDKTDLIHSINELHPTTWTPLSETLAEAGLYFAGKQSWFNSGTYTSPMQQRCQKNYIIIMTDGEPTEDRNWRLKDEPYINGDKIGDYDGDGDESAYPANRQDNAVDWWSPYDTSDYLDDVAKYLYDNDLNSSLGSPGDFEKQNVTTFTIGFQTDQTLLQNTAANGGGAYYVSNNISTLKEAFDSIISQISAENSVFVAPVVPVSKLSSTYAGDRIYVGFFKPQESGRWYGNIKKYGLGSNGELLDADGVAATDATGQILDTARSYWSLTADGPNVDAGGAGELLLADPANRNIYTYQGTQIFLTHADNAFENSNTEITNAELDVATDAERQALFDDIHGVGRTWILQDFIHGKPAVLHYSDKTVIFAGNNGGTLHAFDDTDGSELWAFIPPHQLNRLKLLSDSSTTHDYFIDGAPTIYHGSTQKILIIGERRGGEYYSALDITSYSAPSWLYTIGPGYLGTETLGQSWVVPKTATIQKDASTFEDVFLMGGGYDTNQDLEIPAAGDSVGRAVFSVNVSTGVLSSLSFNYGTFSDMTHSIVSITGIDHDNDGITSRVYAGDLGGKMFAFKDDEDDGTGNLVTDGSWTARRLFSASADGVQRKIQYAPDAVKEEDGETIFFGTGDRADPYETDVVNRIYAIKNNWGADPLADYNLTESDLVDVTDDLIQLGTADEKAAVQTALDAGKGWYIRLENLGEKVVSTPIVFGGVVYFTTYTPDPSGGAVDPNDPCAGTTAKGVGRLYAVNYKTGGSVHNWSTAVEIDQETGLPSVLGKTDRNKIVGYSMPSPPVIAILETGPKLYIGIEGGVDEEDPIAVPDLNIIYWRQITN